MRALVLSGGGSKGAYQAGAIHHLMGDLGMDYDMVCGTSVGAINAAFIAQYPMGNPLRTSFALTQMWMSVTTDKVRKRWFPFGAVSALWKKSVYNSGPLQQWIRGSLDEKAIKASGRKLRLVAVSLGTSEAFVADETTPGIPEWVIASSAFPVMLEPAEINGDLWIDGGVRHITPLAAAVTAGADQIDIILCSDPYAKDQADVGSMHAVPQILLRAIDAMNDQIAREDLKVCALKNSLSRTPGSPHKFVDFRVLKPSPPLTVDSLDFSPEGIRKMYAQGYTDAQNIGPYGQDYTRG